MTYTKIQEKKIARIQAKLKAITRRNPPVNLAKVIAVEETEKSPPTASKSPIFGQKQAVENVL